MPKVRNLPDGDKDNFFNPKVSRPYNQIEAFSRHIDMAGMASWHPADIVARLQDDFSGKGYTFGATEEGKVYVGILGSKYLIWET